MGGRAAGVLSHEGRAGIWGRRRRARSWIGSVAQVVVVYGNCMIRLPEEAGAGQGSVWREDSVGAKEDATGMVGDGGQASIRIEARKSRKMPHVNSANMSPKDDPCFGSWATAQVNRSW